MHLTLQSRVKQIVLLIISQCGLQVITPLGKLRNQHTRMPLRGMFHERSLNYDTFFKTPGTFHWVPAPAIKRKNTYPLVE